MRYSQLIKTVDTTNFTFEAISTINLKAQYNTDRFLIWSSLHKGPVNEVLNMKFSPHFKFLNNEDASYILLQQKYGKKDGWIIKKIVKFLKIYEGIKSNGVLEYPIILKTPLAKNIFNQSYEIFEGHHRVACALALNIKEITCKVINENN